MENGGWFDHFFSDHLPSSKGHVRFISGSARLTEEGGEESNDTLAMPKYTHEGVAGPGAFEILALPKLS